jgi:hypothetical protein
MFIGNSWKPSVLSMPAKKRLPPDVAAELAEHAADEDLSSREIDMPD